MFALEAHTEGREEAGVEEEEEEKEGDTDNYLFCGGKKHRHTHLQSGEQGLHPGSDISSLLCLGEGSQGTSLTLSLFICEWEVVVIIPGVQGCGEDDTR